VNRVSLDNQAARCSRRWLWCRRPAPGSKIRGLDTSGYPAVRLTVVSSKPVATKPALAENGRVVTGLEAQNLGLAKAVVLALDHSQSMTGSSLSDALAAAREFVSIKAVGRSPSV